MRGSRPGSHESAGRTIRRQLPEMPLASQHGTPATPIRPGTGRFARENASGEKRDARWWAGKGVEPHSRRASTTLSDGPASFPSPRVFPQAGSSPGAVWREAVYAGRKQGQRPIWAGQDPQTTLRRRRKGAAHVANEPHGSDDMSSIPRLSFARRLCSDSLFTPGAAA